MASGQLKLRFLPTCHPTYGGWEFPLVKARGLTQQGLRVFITRVYSLWLLSCRADILRSPAVPCGAVAEVPDQVKRAAEPIPGSALSDLQDQSNSVPLRYEMSAVGDVCLVAHTIIASQRAMDKLNPRVLWPPAFSHFPPLTGPGWRD
jgi:hypothetical protein